jgi:hypothetical protein
MKKVLMLSLVFALAGLGGLWAAEGDGSASSIADKISLELEFSATALAVDSEGEVESFTDAGFGEDDSSISFGYDDELWGATASLLFSPETLRIFQGEIGDMAGNPPLSIDELFVWIKPFGEPFKFTGGLFSNTDGLADYTDDIDNWEMGVFVTEDGILSEPTEITNAALVSGFLAEGTLGPVTLQFLLAPNFSKIGADGIVNDLVLSQIRAMLEAQGQSPAAVDAYLAAAYPGAGTRFFRLGGRVIADLGIGTLSAMVKTFQWPMEIINVVGMGSTFTGDKATNTTFGAYFDLTSVENLGISLGYTGFIFASDDSDVDNTLWSGIDIRATWTGIEGLSISTHNNISFASGTDKEWSGMLNGTDASFFALHNVVGATLALTDIFSVNAEVANTFAKTAGTAISIFEFESNELSVGAKLITAVGEAAEFTVGVRADITTEGDETSTVFSIPLSIKVTL